MFESYTRSREFATIRIVAETIRQELGDQVEACPGFSRPEQSEPLNRLFRALARRFLEPIVGASHDPARLISWALRELTCRRLIAGGLNECQIQTLLEVEPGTPDNWLTFLPLVPWHEVMCWLKAAAQDPR
jgi:hypothetical protein